MTPRRPARRSGAAWRTALLVVLLVAVPTAEVWLLLRVGSGIGAVATVGILVAVALLGAWLTRREGSRSWRALTAAGATGRLPSGELADAALVLVGGVLLMLPGFLTDAVGLLFLLPFTRPLARRVLGFFLLRRLRSAGLVPPPGPAGPGAVIEGEVVPDPDPYVVRGEIEDPDRHRR